MTTQEIEDGGHVPMYAKRDVALVRGEGYFLWDSDGKRYYDFASNYGVNILGHSHPAVTRAISTQAGTLISCHQSFYNDVRARYLERLLGVLPPELNKVFFNNSGAEAIEAALKFARAATGRTNVISARRGYHGRTYGALSATADKKYREPYLPVLEGFSHVAFGDVEALEAALTDETAAVILEPVQGEAGVLLAPDGYLQAVRELTRDRGVLLILDEVQTAFRTGKLFAFEHSGAVPDVLCLSKGIANGVPMGVTVVVEDVSSRIPAGTHGNTFGANPLACAAALAVLDEIEASDLLSHSAETGRTLVSKLEGMDAPNVRQVRGLGLMIAVELRERPTKYLRALQERGFLALPAGGTNLRFLPPLIVDDEAVDALVEVLSEVLTAKTRVAT